MSREVYQPPTIHTTSSSGLISTNNTTNTSSQQATNASAADAYDKPVQYLCGDCAAKVLLKRKDPIRCRDCGHRVLYKERTSRMVQFEAR